jgi:hypothetical protein
MEIQVLDGIREIIETGNFSSFYVREKNGRLFLRAKAFEGWTRYEISWEDYARLRQAPEIAAALQDRAWSEPREFSREELEEYLKAEQRK